MDDLISREQALDAIHDWKPSDVFDEFNPTTAFTIIYALPSANPDLSGYSDRLWKSAYDRGYERCKQDAIDAVDVKCLHRGIVKGIQEIIEDLPSAEVRTQMSSADCISRQNAIDALEKLSANYTGVEKREWHPHVRECQKEIECLPSAQPEQRWIPNWMHNGHEPEENDEYLVTWSGYLGDKITKPMLSICEYNDEWITEDIEEYGYNNVMIHAYMPLPEPYKGDADD